MLTSHYSPSSFQWPERHTYAKSNRGDTERGPDGWDHCMLGVVDPWREGIRSLNLEIQIVICSLERYYSYYTAAPNNPAVASAAAAYRKR